jgi:hypothetical protein
MFFSLRRMLQFSELKGSPRSMSLSAMIERLVLP